MMAVCTEIPSRQPFRPGNFYVNERRIADVSSALQPGCGMQHFSEK
jgi:hypothetical protein